MFDNLNIPRRLTFGILLVAFFCSAAPKAVAQERSVVRGYVVSPGDVDSTMAYLRGRYPEQTGARFAYDPRTRQILVVAPDSLQQQIAQEIQARMATTAGGSPQAASSMPVNVETYSLKGISSKNLESLLRSAPGAAQVSGAVQEGGGDPQKTYLRLPNANGQDALLQIDHARGEVTLRGTAAQQRGFQQLLELLREQPKEAQTETRLASVYRANPVQMKLTVAQLQAAIAANTEAATGGTPAREATATQVRDVPALARIFRRRAEQEEAQPAGGQPPAAEQPGQAPQQDPTAAAVEELGGLIGNVQVQFLEDLGVIIVRGPKRDVDRVLRLIEQIEQTMQETRPAIVVHHLQYVNGEALGQLLIRVYDQVLSARQGRVSITPLVKPNALLLIGRPDNVDLVLDLIHKLDKPVPPQTQFRVYRLKHVPATDAAATIQNFFGRAVPGTLQVQPAQQQPGVAPPGAGQPGQQLGQVPSAGTGSGAGLSPRVNVVAEVRTNSLVVQASTDDLAAITSLLRQIDVEAAAATSELRVIRLKNALAAELAPLVQAALRGQPVTGQTGQQQQIFPGQQQIFPQQGGAQAPTRSTSLQLVTVDGRERRILTSVIASDVIITAHPSENSLIVRGPTKAMDLIEALIRELDQLPAAESQIKVFTIINGDATNMAAMLQQLFGQQVTIGRGTGGLFGGGGLGGANLLGQLPLGGPSAGESTLVPLRFAVDARTNSILAAGSAADLAVVETLILRLDESGIEPRKMTVYRLKNAFAEDVANSITSFLTSQRQVIQQNLLFNQAIGPFEQLEREIVVVAEPQTNSVIVSATPKFYNEILQIIKQLDYRPPMVMVQVLIAEVQLGDFYEFGVELGLQDSILFDRGKAALGTAFPQSVPGLSFNNSGLPNVNSYGQENLAGQALSTFGLGRSNTALGYGGLVLSAANESINILIRALQDNNKLQILARPQVMAIHNRQARILVGERVARITGSSINQQGNVQNEVEDVDVGLILNIIPQINDDGIVILNIQAERSSLGPEATGTQIATTPEGQPIRQPNIRNASAVTTISARDGQTVVFAGLIETNKEKAVRRIPYISDIPILGRLFEFESTTDRRRELLIVMTPRILKDDYQYDLINSVESARMSWCLQDVVQVHGDVGLQGSSDIFCDKITPVIYPDEDPTGACYLGEEFHHRVPWSTDWPARRHELPPPAMDYPHSWGAPPGQLVPPGQPLPQGQPAQPHGLPPQPYGQPGLTPPPEVMPGPTKGSAQQSALPNAGQSMRSAPGTPPAGSRRHSIRPGQLAPGEIANPVQPASYYETGAQGLPPYVRDTQPAYNSGLSP